MGKHVRRSSPKVLVTAVVALALLAAAVVADGTENEVSSTVRTARSITNIARLLLGGNVPPDHPLVKYPDSSSAGTDSKMVAAIPGMQGKKPEYSPPPSYPYPVTAAAPVNTQPQQNYAPWQQNNQGYIAPPVQQAQLTSQQAHPPGVHTPGNYYNAPSHPYNAAPNPFPAPGNPYNAPYYGGGGSPGPFPPANGNGQQPLQQPFGGPTPAATAVQNSVYANPPAPFQTPNFGSTYPQQQQQQQQQYSYAQPLQSYSASSPIYQPPQGSYPQNFPPPQAPYQGSYSGQAAQSQNYYGASHPYMNPSPAQSYNSGAPAGPTPPVNPFIPPGSSPGSPQPSSSTAVGQSYPPPPVFNSPQQNPLFAPPQSSYNNGPPTNYPAPSYNNPNSYPPGPAPQSSYSSSQSAYAPSTGSYNSAPPPNPAAPSNSYAGNSNSNAPPSSYPNYNPSNYNAPPPQNSYSNGPYSTNYSPQIPYSSAPSPYPAPNSYNSYPPNNSNNYNYPTNANNYNNNNNNNNNYYNPSVALQSNQLDGGKVGDSYSNYASQYRGGSSKDTSSYTANALSSSPAKSSPPSKYKYGGHDPSKGSLFSTSKPSAYLKSTQSNKYGRHHESLNSPHQPRPHGGSGNSGSSSSSSSSRRPQPVQSFLRNAFSPKILEQDHRPHQQDEYSASEAKVVGSSEVDQISDESAPDPALFSLSSSSSPPSPLPESTSVHHSTGSDHDYSKDFRGLVAHPSDRVTSEQHYAGEESESIIPFGNDDTIVPSLNIFKASFVV